MAAGDGELRSRGRHRDDRPAAGSDLRGMRTGATHVGNRWVLRGQKFFISNGQLADLVVVAAKTDSRDRDSVTLFLVDTCSPGFRRGRNF